MDYQMIYLKLAATILLAGCSEGNSGPKLTGGIMSLSQIALAEVIDRIHKEPAFAVAILDEGTELFIQIRPHHQNKLLQEILGNEIGSIDHDDICKIMAEAKLVRKVAKNLQ